MSEWERSSQFTENTPRLTRKRALVVVHDVSKRSVTGDRLTVAIIWRVYGRMSWWFEIIRYGRYQSDEARWERCGFLLLKVENLLTPTPAVFATGYPLNAQESRRRPISDLHHSLLRNFWFVLSPHPF